jgi:acetyl esterase/lipase
VSWALLGAGLAAALVAWPSGGVVRAWPVRFPAFVLSVFGAELAGWWLALTGVATGGLVAAGGAAATPGWVGLGLAAVAAGVWARQVVLAGRARVLVDEHLGALDGRHEPPPRRRVLKALTPLRLGDRRVTRLVEARYAPGGGRRHLLDVYGPRDGTRDAPVLLQLHGGGWMTGSKRTQGRPLMNQLAGHGWVCVAPNYRLSPRVHHPEHLVDCKRALAWVRAHIAEYGGDPTRVVVTGGSAGGHLAALLALSANDPAFQPGFEAVDTSVLACVPMYGAYALGELFALAGRGRRLGAWMGRLVAGVDVRTDPAFYDAASPVHLVHAAAPPFLVFHGTLDDLVPVEQARRFVLALRAAAPDPVVYVELPGAPHAFDIVGSARTAAAVAGIERFLTWVLRGAPAPTGRQTRPAETAPPGAGTATNDPSSTARTAPSPPPPTR